MKSTIKAMCITLSAIIFLVTVRVFSQEEYRDDCNVTLQEINTTDFGFFTKEDIQKAHANMRTNCPPIKPDETVPQSTYLFDHLVRIGLQKLGGEAEKLGLQSTDNGSAFKELLEQAIGSYESPNITIPANLQGEYDAIRDRDGTYNQSKAKNEGIYEGSTGLYAKYLALCDLARGIVFNPNIVNTAAGTKTIITNTKYNSCVEDTQRIILPQQQNLLNTSTQVVNEHVKTSIQQSMNTYSQSELNTILETATNTKNDFVDISKKASAGGKMKDCNVGS